ncbi:MAG: efflux RND transporter periplasmic adaptor subunit [Pseudomonadales bacterium]|nr:efflux RND transporter periplasmic adaptor subunit [Pseudomonadales bacterium]MDP6470553.1 efflux RND transporter periplasmic adaptor subunit [Pseudomonadales bacterium]MDP6827855.1 efflux RND transporter periplasmic adaptor subunit [Pseudomonadales bacterium]MDP6970556.1 efflux RND transporter periplasmic adaptor subunit [Pseudomonadales bacterium]
MSIRRVLLPFLVVIVGVGAAAVLIATGPRVEMRAPEQVAPVVRTVTAEPRTVRLSVNTHGTVVPRTESDLVPEVSGRVVEVSPALASGGFFVEGDVLLRIDPLDYEVALEQARAGLARAESELLNARKDLKRQSNLKQRNATSEAQRDDSANRARVGEATVREANARLSRARRDLARTAIVAPYDGRVRSEQVDVGQFVNRGAPVAKIFAVDFAEVRLPIHDEELAFLDLPMLGEVVGSVPVPVTLRARFAGEDHEWQGLVVRTEGELDPRTRMVNAVARVADPYAVGEGKPPLSVGLFVDAEIHGTHFKDVIELPRQALRGEGRVFVVDATNQLRFRDVDVLRVSRDRVFLSAGVSAGERVCVSPVQATEDGMLVRLAPTEAETRTVLTPLEETTAS